MTAATIIAARVRNLRNLIESLTIRHLSVKQIAAILGYSPSGARQMIGIRTAAAVGSRWPAVGSQVSL